MDIYAYHPQTGVYVGVDVADEDPLEPGNFLFPAYTTTIAPPKEVNGHERVFNGTKWTYRKITTGEVSETPLPPSLPEYTHAIQSAVDAVAQTKGYDSGHAMATYVASTNLVWREEAEVFVAWRDAVWTWAITKMQQYQTSGSAPEIEAVVQSMLEENPITWPEA